MATPKKHRQIRVPNLCRHRGTGQAYVRINGKCHYLGVWPEGRDVAPASARRAYRQLIDAHLADAADAIAGTEPPVVSPRGMTARTVADVVLHGLIEGDRRLTPGAASHRRRAAQWLVDHYGSEPPESITPAVLSQMVAEHSHLGAKTVAKRTNAVVAFVRWAAEHKLVPSSLYHDLATWERPRGSGQPPVTRDPASVRDVAAVCRSLRQRGRVTLLAMIRVQWHTGMRAGELCRLHTDELDTRGPIWWYTPSKHKTAYLGRRRHIAIGPHASSALRAVWPDGGGYFFRPAESLRGGSGGAMVKAGACYTSESYARAIQRECDRVGVKWTSHELRHAYATRVARQFGIADTRILLGHSSLDVTAIYAHADRKAAGLIAQEIG